MSVRCLRQDVANLTELPSVFAHSHRSLRVFLLGLGLRLLVPPKSFCDYSSHRKPSLKLALFLCEKVIKTYFFLDGSEGKSTPAGKATGEDPARSGLLLRRLRRCPRKATSRSGHLLG